jgi:hypothetical protein
VPDRRQQIVLADHPVALFKQMAQKVEDLRLDRHWNTTAVQFAAITVEHTVLE